MPKRNKLLDDDPPNKIMDIADLPNSQGGSFMTGLLNAIRSGATLPGDVATGRVDPYSDEGIARTQDLAGLAMTGGLAGAGEAGATVGSGPIRAYHGSPHDFDRFDLSRIGTGEGAQAYGHGLYFAENEATAKSYRDALAPKFQAENKIPQRISANEDYAKQLQAQLAQLDPASPEAASLAKRIAFFNESNQRLSAAPNGRMYEVAIHADPKHFLDWDLPLAAQPQVSDTLKRFGIQPQEEYPVLSRRIGEAPIAAHRDLTGADAYFNLGKPDQASAVLNEAGIPGIRYLDQGSRGAGDGSRNIVTFNDQIVEILRKYGVASFAALPPAVQMMLQQGAEPTGNKLAESAS